MLASVAIAAFFNRRGIGAKTRIAQLDRALRGK